MPWAVTNYTSMLVERVDIWYNIAIETMDKLMNTWITLRPSNVLFYIVLSINKIRLWIKRFTPGQPYNILRDYFGNRTLTHAQFILYPFSMSHSSSYKHDLPIYIKH